MSNRTACNFHKIACNPDGIAGHFLKTACMSDRTACPFQKITCNFGKIACIADGIARYSLRTAGMSDRTACSFYKIACTSDRTAGDSSPIAGTSDSRASSLYGIVGLSLPGFRPFLLCHQTFPITYIRLLLPWCTMKAHLISGSKIFGVRKMQPQSDLVHGQVRLAA